MRSHQLKAERKRRRGRRKRRRRKIRASTGTRRTISKTSRGKKKNRRIGLLKPRKPSKGILSSSANSEY